MSKKFDEMEYQGRLFNAKMDRHISKRGGDNQFITPMPLLEEYSHRIKLALEKINAIAKPTLDNMRDKRTVKEMSQKIYHRINPTFENLNTCLLNSLDYHDSFKCQNNAVNFLETQGIQIAMEITKEY